MGEFTAILQSLDGGFPVVSNDVLLDRQQTRRVAPIADTYDRGLFFLDCRTCRGRILLM
jgi:hypothetical protein